ncbi:MAG: preprotein translocase subunit YajC [Bacillota bacterium]
MQAELMNFVWIIGIFAVFYIFLIRPQQQQKKKWREMVSQIDKGDRIVTRGGFYATVLSVREDTLRVRLAEGIEVKMVKNGVGYVLSHEERRDDYQEETAEE